jgi:hypothetical protein
VADGGRQKLTGLSLIGVKFDALVECAQLFENIGALRGIAEGRGTLVGA